MRKFSLVALVLSALAISLPVARADSPVIRIVDQPHLNFDGTWRNNELATLLQPDGRLGKPVYFPSSPNATWVIDAEIVDEAVAMSQGYIFSKVDQPVGKAIAIEWLKRLRVVTFNNRVIALPYGNADESLVKSLAPSELKFYTSYSNQRLATVLGRPVTTQSGWGKGRSGLSYLFRKSYVENRRTLFGLSKAINADEITNLRARLGSVLNPNLNRNDRAYFSYTSTAETVRISSKLRVVSGRYQLTSESVKVPITLVNNFDTAAVVSLSLIPMNGRVRVTNIHEITIAPKSRMQLSVPFTVIAPGSTLVIAQFMTPTGLMIGNTSRLNLSLTLIDSRVTWFTTGAAILLFLAAVAQSVRRVRQGRKKEELEAQE